jgi:uncharacterized OB-fold protein
MELEKYELGGTAYKDKDLEEGKLLSLPFQPDLEYAWDDGVAIGRYLAEMKEGRIIARKCDRCGRIMLPPRMFCELCWRPTDRWVYCEDTGTVNTFSICYVNWDASRIGEKGKPYLPAVIEIDGASEGMGILHVLGGIQPEDIEIGMRVKAVWKNPADREGAITDIAYFEPQRG